ncbi:carbohydrate kinase [Petroclostridium sp. X23]|uniref:carbohydrate kinase family protein n=1 Tax=Petroclostridium sp. X23 TaxID=3045146 RepID=UPI0024ADAD58|nr:carbohydrate kinase [Petroclostridium sp. X23]WHH58077.1 carbohydrate kinase [Petroclostridium sp. X23]
MYDVVAIGELLIDFTPAGETEEGTVLFERNPGGAPGNVLAILSKLGRKAALIGKVGDDQFGRFLSGVLEDIGVDTKGLVFTKEANTTLAFVHLNGKGDRSFSFYRKPGADLLLDQNEVNIEMLKSTKIFHFGTVSMTDNPSRSATLMAVKIAKENGAIISFDPNLRIPLWNDLGEAKAMIEKGLEYAEILKVSNEELEFITGKGDLEEGSEIILNKYGIPVILVTLGPSGCFYRIGDKTGILPAYDVITIDTTGAGDAFLGSFLYQVIEKGMTLSNLSKANIEEMIDFANAAGSVTTVKKGAIPAMPVISEIEECIKSIPKLIL